MKDTFPKAGQRVEHTATFQRGTVEGRLLHTNEVEVLWDHIEGKSTIDVRHLKILPDLDVPPDLAVLQQRYAEAFALERQAAVVRQATADFDYYSSREPNPIPTLAGDLMRLADKTWKQTRRAREEVGDRLSRTTRDYRES